MKSLKEIEKISFSQLEDIADGKGEEKIEIPDSLSEKMESVIPAAATTSSSHSRKYPFWAAVSAGVVAVAAAVGIFFLPNRANAITDTYDDPYLAYAEVENVLKYMSSKMDKGRDGIEKLDSATEKIVETIKNL